VNKKKKSSFIEKTPHALVLLFIIIVIGALMSYVIPAGEFNRVVQNGRTVVEPGSFQYTDAPPAGLFDIFRAIPNGIQSAITIVILILLVGGAVEIFISSGALNIAMVKLTHTLGGKGDIYILLALMIFFSILGGFLGWIEAAIPFIPLAVAIVVSLGYDAMTAAGVTIVGCMLSFAVGPTNLYTVGISHQIAELPMFSGITYRSIIFLVFTALGIYRVLRYAVKTKADPSLSLTPEVDTSDIKLNMEDYEDQDFTLVHKAILLVLGITLFFVVYGMLNLGWSINDMSAVFVLGGLLAGALARFTPNKIAKLMVEGSKKVILGALIVGVARGVQWILSTGGITDTIIYSLSAPLENLPGWITAIGMYGVHLVVNFFIPSGSGQTMATMPIMVPLADVVGITRQTAVQAFQFGDGITNLLYFTYGTLLYFLSVSKVSYQKWFKFIWPLIWKMIVLSIIFLIIAVQIGYGPF